jgi:DNA processing protein
MADRDELSTWLELTLIPGLGGQAQRKLLTALGLPAQILAAGRAVLARHIGETLAQRIAQRDAQAAVDAALTWAAQPGHHILTLADADYPQQLLQTADPPTLLYVWGNPALLARPGIAVVGSRNATAQGLSNAEHFSAALSAAGLTIVSGLALGIDAAAHRGALRGKGSTVAVLGTGIDIRYPTRNRTLYEAIVEAGALVSEFPLGTPAVSTNFPRRNRIISGIARGVLVVEAALSSGSLITARLAGEQGRELYAIPGSIHSPLSKGCHALIKQGAKLVESAQDVLEELQLPAAIVSPATPAAATRAAATEEADALLALLGGDPCGIDLLCQRSGLTPESVSAMLLTLELEGKVASLPGGRYQRIP